MITTTLTLSPWGIIFAAVILMLCIAIPASENGKDDMAVGFAWVLVTLILVTLAYLLGLGLDAAVMMIHE